jgi:hypothetical protein
MMRFDQRMFARLKYLDLMAELYDNAFQTFVQNVMCARYPNFADRGAGGAVRDGRAAGCRDRACALAGGAGRLDPMLVPQSFVPIRKDMSCLASGPALLRYSRVPSR